MAAPTVPEPKPQAAQPSAPAGPSVTLPPETDKSVFRATGRRKTSVARVSMRRGKGAFVVNGKEADLYFPGERERSRIRLALRAAKLADQFDVRANVAGGGASGQAGAVLLGVARILKRFPGAEPVLRAEKLLTRDPREKERRKYGRRKARRGFQWTKR